MTMFSTEMPEKHIKSTNSPKSGSGNEANSIYIYIYMLGKRKWKKWTDENLIGH